MLDYTVQPKTIATWFVNHVDRDAGEAITHLKLQKLVYYAQAWYLANFDKPLCEEDHQAWAHGPVYKSLYDKYRDHGWQSLPVERHKSIDSNLEGFLKSVFDEYGQYGAKKLEELTHSETPWIMARGDVEPWERSSALIDKLLMRNFYANKIGKDDIEQLPAQ